jgi:glycosyltransferase involved in cell wall biosynthesis
MGEMRILVCTIEAPAPPLNGLRRQLSALLAQLRKEHQVRVLGYRWPDQGEQAADAGDMRLLPAPGGRGSSIGPAVTAVLRGRPPGVDRLASGLGPALLQEVQGFRPDVIHVTTGRLAALGRVLRGRPAVLAALDAWHLNVTAEEAAAGGLRRPALWMVSRLVRRFEASEYRRFGAVVVVSAEDRRELLALDSSLPVTVVPNGVDADAFGHDGSPRDPNRILFTGVMDYAPNVTAAGFLARRVFPLVRRAHRSARLAIVGRDPLPEVVALGRLEGVEVLGGVPDLRPWLSGSRVFACPMRSGTGIKNKLLEAMANGLPCVATPLALQGLEAVPGEHVLIGEDEAALAGHLGRVLTDDGLAASVGRAGREYVTAHHGWSAAAAGYQRVYRDVIARAASPGSPDRPRGTAGS